MDRITEIEKLRSEIAMHEDSMARNEKVMSRMPTRLPAIEWLQEVQAANIERKQSALAQLLAEEA